MCLASPLGESRTCELRLRKKDGGLTWIQSYAQCQAAEEVQGHHRLLGALVDITERKLAAEENARLQAQLQQAQKMESLGTLAGGIAHDMNNVLGAILGLASAKSRPSPRAAATTAPSRPSSKAAVRGGKMVKSLLSFARQSPAEERELDLNAILREEVRLLERTTLSKVRLELDLAPDLRPIRGDASALTHAFMNLCVNAVDAMAENGTLTLRTRNLDGDWVEVLVEDTGPGCPGGAGAGPGPLLHHQGGGQGHGAGPVHGLQHREGPPGADGDPERARPGHRVRMRFPACEPGAGPLEPSAEPRPGAIPARR